MKPGRQSAMETTIFDSTGLALQDLACATHVYKQLTTSGRATSQFDFLR